MQEQELVYQFLITGMNLILVRIYGQKELLLAEVQGRRLL